MPRTRKLPEDRLAVIAKVQAKKTARRKAKKKAREATAGK